MKTFIKVKTSFEGLHCYSNAPEAVAFLRNMHRHIFYVTCKIEVYTDERELEFFMVKRDVDLYIKNELQDKNYSCEQYAKQLLRYIDNLYSLNRAITVEVSEDNENSAEVCN